MKEKHGRRDKSGQTDHSLEAEVLRAYKSRHRGLMTHAIENLDRRTGQPYEWGGKVWGDPVDTIHMALAKQFGIPCQQVLDIIDPDRKKKQSRMKMWDMRQRMWSERANED